MTTIIVLAVLAVVAVAVIGIYNGLVRLNVQTDNAWSPFPHGTAPQCWR